MLREHAFCRCVVTFKRASLLSSPDPNFVSFLDMSKRNFLVVPAKAANEVDLSARINSYIKTCLSLTPETQNAVKESLDELNRMRRNAFLHDECGKSTSSIDNMHK